MEPQDPDKIISLQDIAATLNNVNINEDIIVFDIDLPSRHNKQKIFPLRVDALIITLVERGESKIRIDLNEYQLRKDTLMVIQPNNYLSTYDTSENFKACMIACSRRTIEEITPKLTDLLPMLIHNRTEPVTELTPEQAQEMRIFYHILLKKLAQPKTEFIKQKALCLLQAALYEMMEIFSSRKNQSGHKRTRKEETMAKFILLVSENFRISRSVSYYAEKLCISSKHLSAIVKEVSGRTAGDWIDNYVCMESKVLLKTTDMTIQEIANKLNFASQSFFGKYFRNLTGQSPTEFRRSD